MKLRRRYKRLNNEDDEECLIQNNHHRVHEHSKKVRRWIWKFAKGTWKAFKIGFQTTVSSQPFCVALEPTALATTIVEYQVRKRDQ